MTRKERESRTNHACFSLGCLVALVWLVESSNPNSQTLTFAVIVTLCFAGALFARIKMKR